MFLSFNEFHFSVQDQFNTFDIFPSKKSDKFHFIFQSLCVPKLVEILLYGTKKWKIPLKIAFFMETIFISIKNNLKSTFFFQPLRRFEEPFEEIEITCNHLRNRVDLLTKMESQEISFLYPHLSIFHLLILKIVKRKWCSNFEDSWPLIFYKIFWC